MKKTWKKGEFAKKLVLLCLRVMTLVLLWAMLMKTACTALDRPCDVADVLGFAGAFFGGELTLLAFKRIFAKEGQNEKLSSEADEP